MLYFSGKNDHIFLVIVILSASYTFILLTFDNLCIQKTS